MKAFFFLLTGFLLLSPDATGKNGYSGTEEAWTFIESVISQQPGWYDSPADRQEGSNTSHSVYQFRNLTGYRINEPISDYLTRIRWYCFVFIQVVPSVLIPSPLIHSP